MTKKVYLNPDRLDTAINSLTYLADDAETAKTNIDNQFSAEGDPMDPSTDLFTIGNSIETVRGLVSTLTSFKQAILDAKTRAWDRWTPAAVSPSSCPTTRA